ncbi:UNVERIFIED_ORG: hypothetical protein M2438_001441 [Methylobacterium sp. SuP10 SLI 274]|uniref:hypothetical protein n=1 Tax=Methylorubrum extorquens TaxID=408 RepID=UPI0020A1908A|nr:hypothetical protein [Methylorubrum extorquens]MDF9862654.1 hypothetical protein [Methylorubrum pseudosasae]MDH6636266.1 hypothetical protein [Methylobacterium sp. SuP10 SLI 274]MDH6665442.1 hypothetical protein [Methylorubrum zatmanii]MCP1557365.1 hypothetical protein [Methylorubrum extorquens]MDF9790948.1 hypothetical protein [Methylorubrum extorquens]
MRANAVEDRAHARRRTERELRRLEALVARKRFRRRSLRALRGSAGAAATFGALLKVKVVGTLAGKAAIAVLVGLGFAWPALVIGVIGVIGVVGIVLAVVSLFSGEGGPHGFDVGCTCDCAGKEKRAERLKALIAQRRAWLAAPAGPAPSVRWDARGRRHLAGSQRKRGR